jgi:hypothetical protein
MAGCAAVFWRLFLFWLRKQKSADFDSYYDLFWGSVGRAYLSIPIFMFVSSIVISMSLLFTGEQMPGIFRPFGMIIGLFVPLFIVGSFFVFPSILIFSFLSFKKKPREFANNFDGNDGRAF